jgi:hypothetical protein
MDIKERPAKQRGARGGAGAGAGAGGGPGRGGNVYVSICFETNARNFAWNSHTYSDCVFKSCISILSR